MASSDLADFWKKKGNKNVGGNKVSSVTSSKSADSKAPSSKQSENKSTNPTPKNSNASVQEGWKEFENEKKRVDIERVTGKKMLDIKKYPWF